MNTFEHLLSPMKIGKVTFKNRLAVGAMGAGYGNRCGAHGEYLDNAIEYMVERGRGGFGMFVAGCLQTDYKVDPHDEYSHFMNNQLDFKKKALRLNERAGWEGMKMIQQLSVGEGRNGGPGVYSCSPTHLFGNPNAFAKELTKEQIHQKVECFVNAAKLMKDSGFAGIELHGHWGYLLDNFAMSITNLREDEYGGSLENRLRFAKELIQGTKQVCGDDFLVIYRLGLKSYLKDFDHADYTGEHEAGRTLEEAIEMCKLLESYGVDAINGDAGVYESFYYAAPPIYIQQGFTMDLAAEVKKNVSIPVLCGTRMNDPWMTEAALAEGKIDGVVLARQSLADPYYVKKLEKGLPDKIRPCIGCDVGCMGKIRSGQFMACAVNPILMKERVYGPQPALQKKKVAVIGGGIAGMEAARTAKMRGHDVTIYEKTDVLGGNLIAAGSHDFKKEIRQLAEWYRSEIRDLQIPVKYNTAMDAEKIKASGAEAVVLAMGSTPVMPRIPGIDHPKCQSGVEALVKHHNDMGQKIVVVGGGLVGCETAVDYAQQGKDVTIVEMSGGVLQNSAMIPLMVTQAIPDMIEHYHVKVLAGHGIVAINDEGALVKCVATGEEKVLPADNVIMSIGMRPVPFDVTSLYGCGLEVYTVGDEQKVGNVFTSIGSAYEVARTI